MADDDLRELERRWSASGALEDAEAFMRARQRVGLGGIRFDGLYAVRDTGEAAGTIYWARFYPDGLVITVTTEVAEAADLAAWFHRDWEHASKGRYELERDTIRFATTSSNGTVEYEGAIAEGRLELASHSRINDHRARHTYVFEPVALT